MYYKPCVCGQERGRRWEGRVHCSETLLSICICGFDTRREIGNRCMHICKGCLYKLGLKWGASIGCSCCVRQAGGLEEWMYVKLYTGGLEETAKSSRKSSLWQDWAFVHTTSQHIASYCITLQHAATHCNTLQRTVTHHLLVHHHVSVCARVRQRDRVFACVLVCVSAWVCVCVFVVEEEWEFIIWSSGQTILGACECVSLWGNDDL